MRSRLASRIALIIASALLVVAAILLSQPLRHSYAWQVPAADSANVEAVLRRGASNFGMTPEDYRHFTRPRFEQIDGRTCIRLVTHRSDEVGNYRECYDSHGSITEQRATISSFEAESLWDRFGDWVW